MTPDELDAIEARADAITARPLVGMDDDRLRAIHALARQNVPALIVALRQAWATLDDGRLAIHRAGSDVERASAEVTRATRALLASNAERDAALAEVERLRAGIDDLRAQHAEAFARVAAERDLAQITMAEGAGRRIMDLVAEVERLGAAVARVRALCDGEWLWSVPITYILEALDGEPPTDA